MATEIKSLDEQTVADFKSVVSRMFSNDATWLIDYILTNPLRKVCSSCGDIVYEDGHPVCIQAAILRKMYLGKTSFLGVIGGFLARIPESSPEALLQVIERTLASRGGSRLFFANTAVRTTVKLYGLLGVRHNGGDTWDRVLVRRIRPILCWYLKQSGLHPRLPRMKFSVDRPKPEESVVYAKGGVSLKRRLAIDEQDFDNLWKRYLEGNVGVVSSRDSETLKWVFDRQLQEGRAMLFCAFANDGLIGYLVVSRSSLSSREWRVMDMLAIGNDQKTIDLMLTGVIRYIKTRTSAISVSVKGFPAGIDSVLRRHFDREIKLSHNPFLYAAQGEETFQTTASQSLLNGWFGCPFDGDEIL